MAAPPPPPPAAPPPAAALQEQAAHAVRELTRVWSRIEVLADAIDAPIAQLVTASTPNPPLVAALIHDLRVLQADCVRVQKLSSKQEALQEARMNGITAASLAASQKTAAQLTVAQRSAMQQQAVVQASAVLVHRMQASAQAQAATQAGASRQLPVPGGGGAAVPPALSSAGVPAQPRPPLLVPAPAQQAAVVVANPAAPVPTTLPQTARALSAQLPAQHPLFMVPHAQPQRPPLEPAPVVVLSSAPPESAPPPPL